MKTWILLCSLAFVGFVAADEKTPAATCADIPVSDAEWKAKLSPEAYKVLRERGTERPFTGKLLAEKREGRYLCVGCGSTLFLSDSKFESGTGWPSFFQPASDTALGTKEDKSHGMVRTEVHCNTCKGHLGHVFNDGPRPGGLRYCINSVSLVFLPGD